MAATLADAEGEGHDGRDSFRISDLICDGEEDISFVLCCCPLPTVTTAATLADAEGEGRDGRDRTNDLTDDLLRQVVSHLPIRDAVRTTTLSTRWRHIWHSAPLVLFDQHISAATEAQHVAAISSILASHTGPRIRTAHLTGFNFHDRKPELAQWVRILAEKDVEDLVLITRPCFGFGNALITSTFGYPALDLPADILLRCKKLRRLYLGYWAFPNITNLPGGVGVFPDLEELAILDTYTKDNDLDHMLASCPALKKLALVLNNPMPQHVRLRGKELECAIVCSSVADVALEAKCLKRLIMWDMWAHDLAIRIAGDVPALKVLGYLDAGCHQLQFGGVQVQAGTNASPMRRVPSVKILAIMVDFSEFRQVQKLPSFLGCFPNIEILHVESSARYELRKNYAKFFEELGPIECLLFHITKVFLYDFRGHQSDMEFLKYLVSRASQMQKLTLVLPFEDLKHSVDENKIKVLLGELLLEPEWATETCKVLLLRPVAELVCFFHRAFDLSIEDPFLKDDGEELFSSMKRREQDVN
uniref:FBD domain-containing protein n=1 Tax=Setaria viridis TaxID=4556 RepID=A0A4U6UIU9_SETVI|nr:F-box/FBD/LRR-repeat protein At1g13570-like [Setaria viridis]TKW15362.1 hypothetical protein SEVIR_5G233100v2 [Setaria viridis]